jgi:GAF domain-containing protein
MAEELIMIDSTDKRERYESLLPQVKGLLDGEDDQIANLANLASVLKYGMGFFWVGFYLVRGEELVLGPFQGPIACTRIRKGKGVCGQAWEMNRTIIVEDVDEYPGHIACSSDSKSEIVVPMLKDDKVWGVLDVDSDQLASFNEVDQKYLEKMIGML